jgi:hypothetical protein
VAVEKELTIIRRSKLYMQTVVLSPSAGVFVVWSLRKFFLNDHTTKTPAEGESTTGCMYNLDLLMMVSSFSTATRQRHLQRG